MGKLLERYCPYCKFEHYIVHEDCVMAVIEKTETLLSIAEENLREVYIITPVNIRICTRCGSNWEIDESEHHEDFCILDMLLERRTM